MGFLAKRSNPSVVCFATTDPNAKYANDHIYDDGIVRRPVARHTVTLVLYLTTALENMAIFLLDCFSFAPT